MTNKECLKIFNSKSETWKDRKFNAAAREVRNKYGKSISEIDSNKLSKEIVQIIYDEIRGKVDIENTKLCRDNATKTRNKFIEDNGLVHQTKIMEKRNMTLERFKLLVASGAIKAYNVPYRNVPMYKLEEVPDDTDLNAYMSLRDVANRYRIHRDIVHRLAQEGFLETHSVKGSHMLWFKLDEVEPVMIEFKDKYNFQLLNKFE